MPFRTSERNRGTRDDARGNLDAVDAGDGCALLLYAAQGWKQGTPIDRLSGRLGWSHLAVDADERAATTGQRLMIDHRVGVGMHRRPKRPAAYQDRPRARIELPQPLASETRLALKRLVGSDYRARSVLRYAGQGDLSGTVCSQVVFECLPPDLRRLVQSASPPLGLFGRLLRRWNPDIVTPNQFALAFGIPPASEVGPEGITVQLPAGLTAVASGAPTARAAKPVFSRAGGGLAPRATSLAHHSDCRLLVRVVSIRLLPDSDDLGSNWRFSFDVNARGPSTVRSRRLSVRHPLINPRKILYHEWIPHCDGQQVVNLCVHAVQYQGIDDAGVAQSDPAWTLSCPGQAIRDLQVPVDGRHEHAEIAVRVLLQAYHAHGHPD